MATDVDLHDPKVTRTVHKDWRPVVKTAAGLGWTGRSIGKRIDITSPDGAHTIGVQMANGGTDGARLRAAARLLGNLTTDKDALREAVENVIDEDRTVVSVKPWMARASARDGLTDLYESDSVNERTWSNGDVDYLCRVEGCDYQSDNPRSVASHAGVAHTRRGEKGRAKPTPVLFDQPTDGPRTKRVGALAREIADAMEATSGKTVTREEAARAMAEFIIEQRIAKGRERIEEDPEPSEPGDILARIKTLLLREDARQWEQERRGLLDERETLIREREAATEAAKKAKETLRSLAQLAADDLEG